MRTNMISIVAMVALIITGCDGFGPPPGSMSATDAGVMPVDDGGREMPREIDSGMRPMPRELDGGAPLGDVPASGSPCDPDRDTETYDCALEGCSRAYLVCLGNETWRCVPDTDAICMPRTETDAGVTEEIDAGCDAGMPAAAIDSGVPTAERDAGPIDYCVPESFVGCWLSCGLPGYIECNTATGRYDSRGGACQAFEGLECSSGHDAGMRDAGVDAGHDAGMDAGPVAVDAGHDAGSDAGHDAGTDAGPTWTRTGVYRFRMNADTLAEIGHLCPTGGTPHFRLYNGYWRDSCGSPTLDIPVSALSPGPYDATIFCQTDTACPAAGAEPSWAGYVSPIVESATRNTRVSATDFVEISFDGRPAREGTFYCRASGSDYTRVQVQIVDASTELPTGCSGTTGR